MEGAGEDSREMWEGLEQSVNNFSFYFSLFDFFLLRHNSHGMLLLLSHFSRVRLCATP